MVEKLMNLDNLSNADLQLLYNCNIRYSHKSVDDPEYWSDWFFFPFNF